MYSIGIRVAVPKKSKKGRIYYSVLNATGDEIEIVKTNYLVIPAALDVPEQLAYIRTNILSLIMKYDIKLAGLRITESIAGSIINYRFHIEGVLQELFANSSIHKYSLLNMVSFSSLLGIPVADVKACIKEKEIFGEIDDWLSYKIEERECIVAATSMLQMGAE